MGDEKTSGYEYTVGALLLQAALLLGYAGFLYLDSLATSYPLAFVGLRTLAIFYGVLGAIAIWLAGDHHTNHGGSSYVLWWAIISLISIILSLLFIIPSMLVILTLMNENPTSNELSNPEV